MAPSVGHLLLKGLDGNTSCLRFYSPTITGAAIQQQISSILRLPVDSLLILSGTRLIFPDTTLSADTHGFFPSCSLSVPLPGGKGGFGSLLRGAGTKAGQKKTSNFDACRDMSGRRLRHVNAEKKLKEWKAQAKERELEKVANEFLKKQAKQKEKSSESSQAMEKFEKEIFKTKEEIESAVAVGLAEAKKLGKRKVVEDESLPPSSSKYARIWFDDVGTDEDDASDEDDESGEDDASDVDNDRQVSRGSDEELEDGPNHDKVLVCSGAEEGSRMKSENLLQLPKSEAESESASEIGKSESESASELGKSEEVTEGAKAEAAIENRKLEEDAERAEAESASEIEKSGGGVLCAKVESTSEIRKSGEGSECVTAEGDVEGAVIGTELSESLDFDKFLHPSDMEVLGLERLKQELQKRGLKCGGSLAERAGRLFLLKTCSLENLDKKHFAKEKKP